jgi:CrcB protein
MERLLLICAAGAAGTGLRYVVSVWAARAFGAEFPWGTLIVNVAGCFLMAIVMHIALHTASLSPTARLTLTTGFMGGLTTYSSFNYETTELFRDGAARMAFANIGATMACCFAAGILGLVAARSFAGG